MKSTADFIIEYTLKIENLWLAVYYSFECEPHSNNYGGYIILNEEGKMLRAEGGYPGLCQNLSTKDILCLNHFMAQGVLKTWISHCKLTPRYRLSCKDVFVAKDDSAFDEENGKMQYISRMYIKDKDHFYFEVNQKGMLFPVHCQRQGDIFKCKGLEKLKRRMP